ncbi:MAG: NADH-quinone oxidoreductase subunit C [Asgard group archaeon]|nr:NADH-quinone oxidoreductase subunit C [Asgard group archaeon]
MGIKKLFITRDVELILENIRNKFDVEYTTEDNICYLKVSKDNYLAVAEYLKKQEFQRLLTVSAVDWINKGCFEIYFILHNLTENMYIKVATEIPRDNPKIPSLHELWPNAALHEKETWELFDISFEGNNDLNPLFLESKSEIPPFRKDFNWRENRS